MAEKIINQFKMEFLSRSENESFARQAVSFFTAQLDPELSELTDIRTAVSEAVTNAVVHGYRGTEGVISLRVCYTDAGRVKITVKDSGCGIADVEQAMQPLYTTDAAGERGGMGFTIMKSFMDGIRVKSAPGRGTSVTMIKRIRGAARQRTAAIS